MENAPVDDPREEQVEFTTYPRVRTTYLGKLIYLSQRRFYLSHNIDLTREQERILRELRREGGMDQSTLAQRVEQNRYNVSKTLKILEDRGLIARTHKPDSKRQYAIDITPEGLALSRQAFQLLEEWRDVFFRGYERHEVYLLRDMVERSIANLEEDLDEQRAGKASRPR